MLVGTLVLACVCVEMAHAAAACPCAQGKGKRQGEGAGNGRQGRKHAAHNCGARTGGTTEITVTSWELMTSPHPVNATEGVTPAASPAGAAYEYCAVGLSLHPLRSLYVLLIQLPRICTVCMLACAMVSIQKS